MNPLYGHDGAGHPPGGPFGGQFQAQGQPYMPHQGMNAGYGGWFGGYYPYANHYPYGPFAQPMTMNGPNPNAYPIMPNGANFSQARAPNPVPNLNPAMPAAQMTNSTGGTGCEPGYNYFFPAEHTKIHVFKTSTPPWQLPAHTVVNFHACHVPTTTTCADILKGFGATNPTAKKNKCFEIAQGGNGKWYKGLCINGDDKDMLKRKIVELGWDGTRTGHPGEKPVVCLWLTKDG